MNPTPDVAVPMTKDGRVIDWSKALEAAQAIVKRCHDAGFTAPEDVAGQGFHLDVIARRVNDLVAATCLQLGRLTKQEGALLTQIVTAVSLPDGVGNGGVSSARSNGDPSPTELLAAIARATGPR